VSVPAGRVPIIQNETSSFKYEERAGRADSPSGRGPVRSGARLALFDRRYRELCGADEPYGSSDPG